jgi:predicted PurR-regulated permease PerM
MEFFIPSLLLFLLAIGVTFAIAPRATPLVAALLSIGFLTFGVYQHYKLFASEYRLSTWQQGLKLYAPALMIAAIIIFIIYAILAFFTKGSVPVPNIPNITEPNENTVTNQVIQSLNKVGNMVNNTKNNVIENINNTINNVNKNRTNILGLNNTSNRGNTNKKNGNLSRSFLETI